MPPWRSEFIYSRNHSRQLCKIALHLALMTVASLYTRVTQAAWWGSDHAVNVSASFDRASPAGRLTMWDSEEGGLMPPQHPYSIDYWRCLSDTNPASGACTRRPAWGTSWGSTSTIRLSFTEKRSRVTTVLNLTAESAYYRRPPSDGPDGCAIITRSTAIHMTALTQCPTAPKRPYGGRTLSVYLEPEEYKKLPSGGIWEGRLVLEQREWLGRWGLLGIWTANITLDMTDRHSGAIYLPAFGKADALVDLNLRTKPLSTAPGGEVSGQAVIDTCLYDGYNSNNDWLQVTLSDRLPAYGRAADIFSVVKTGTNGNLARDRVDYRVAMDYNGSPVTMENGKVRTLSGVNTALIRPVALPGFSVPVVCTPAPLTLTVLPFAKASKTAGRYNGTLRINLAARTLAP